MTKIQKQNNRLYLKDNCSTSYKNKNKLKAAHFNPKSIQFQI
jgi:hypothetical protein